MGNRGDGLHCDRLKIEHTDGDAVEVSNEFGYPNQLESWLYGYLESLILTIILCDLYCCSSSTRLLVVLKGIHNVVQKWSISNTICDSAT